MTEVGILILYSSYPGPYTLSGYEERRQFGSLIIRSYKHLEEKRRGFSLGPVYLSRLPRRGTWMHGSIIMF